MSVGLLSSPSIDQTNKNHSFKPPPQKNTTIYIRELLFYYLLSKQKLFGIPYNLLHPLIGPGPCVEHTIFYLESW